MGGNLVYAGGGFTSIGALPQRGIAAIGDLTTPTLLSLVSAQAEPGRVRLTWFSADGHIVTATAYRRTVESNWESVGRTSPDGTGRLVFEDTQVTAGSRYGYRLGVVQGGRETFLGETWVDVPRALELALGGSSPNPAFEGLTIAFSLPDASPARLELLDLAGRRMLSREVGGLGTGSHVINLAQNATLVPGLYLLRLSRGSRSLTARTVIIR